MQVDVKYFLSGDCAIGEKEIDAFARDWTFAKRGCDSLGYLEEMLTCGDGKLREVGGVFQRNDEYVPGGNGLDIHKGNAHIILVDEARLTLFENDVSENTGFHPLAISSTSQTLCHAAAGSSQVSSVPTCPSHAQT